MKIRKAGGKQPLPKQHTAWQHSPALNSTSKLVEPMENSNANDISVYKTHLEPYIEHEYGKWIKLYQLKSTVNSGSN